MSLSGRPGSDGRRSEDEVLPQKKFLLKPGTVSYAAGVNSVSASAGSSEHSVTAAQRQALQQANASSFGNFVTQDCMFGNGLMPVIPRLDPAPPSSPSGGPTPRHNRN